MTPRTLFECIAAALAAALVLFALMRQSRALDERAAAEIEAIRARAANRPMVVASSAPITPTRDERDVVRAVVRGARPVATAAIATGATATGAPQIACPPATGTGPSVVTCPSPEIGCVTHITGWRHDAGAVLATGTQTLRWRWPGQDWQQTTAAIDATNTRVSVVPNLIVATPTRWLVGATIGLDDDAEPRYALLAARRVGSSRNWHVYALGQVMAGGGDVVVSAGVAVSR
jgi:hypothetical protein